MQGSRNIAIRRAVKQFAAVSEVAARVGVHVHVAAQGSLQRRLRSRFEGGLVVDVGVVDASVDASGDVQRADAGDDGAV